MVSRMADVDEAGESIVSARDGVLEESVSSSDASRPCHVRRCSLFWEKRVSRLLVCSTERSHWWKRVGLGRSIGVWVLMSRSYQRLFAVMVQVHETYTCQSFIATHPMIIDWLSAAETVLRSRLRNPVRGSGSRPCKHRRLKKRKHSMSKSDAKLVKQSEEIVKTILHRMSSEEVDEEWPSQEGQSMQVGSACCFAGEASQAEWEWIHSSDVRRRTHQVHLAYFYHQ